MWIQIGLALFSLNAMANWTELKPESSYKLSQPIQLVQTQRSRTFIDLSAGDEFYLKEIVPLSSVRVNLFIFRYLQCPGPEMETEMEIIRVQGSNPMIEVGAQIQENCEFQVFVDNSDLYSKSLFE